MNTAMIKSFGKTHLPDIQFGNMNDEVCRVD